MVIQTLPILLQGLQYLEYHYRKEVTAEETHISFKTRRWDEPAPHTYANQLRPLEIFLNLKGL